MTDLSGRSVVVAFRQAEVLLGWIITEQVLWRATRRLYADSEMPHGQLNLLLGTHVLCQNVQCRVKDWPVQLQEGFAIDLTLVVSDGR